MTRKIGTTGRGIGPAYEDKATRRDSALWIWWIRMASVKSLRASCRKKIFTWKNFCTKSRWIRTRYWKIHAYAKRLAPHVADVSVSMNRAIQQGKQVLFEGAQGTHLDIDHGTYPYVTSSNTVSGNACCGTGVGPKERSPGSWALSRPIPRGSAPGLSHRNYSMISATACRTKGRSSVQPQDGDDVADGWIWSS